MHHFIGFKMASIGNTTDSKKFSQLEIDFLATGVLFGAVLILGAIYYVLYTTKISPPRKMRKLRPIVFEGAAAENGPPKKPKFSLFLAKKKKEDDNMGGGKRKVKAASANGGKKWLSDP